MKFARKVRDGPVHFALVGVKIAQSVVSLHLIGRLDNIYIIKVLRTEELFQSTDRLSQRLGARLADLGQVAVPVAGLGETVEGRICVYHAGDFRRITDMARSLHGEKLGGGRVL